MSSLEILECFVGATQPISAKEVTRQTGLPRSSVFRELKLLVQDGYLHHNASTKDYLLGPRTLRLGMSARAQMGLSEVVTAPLLTLSADAQETVTFSIFDPPWRTCIFVAEGPSDLRQVAQAGSRYPLHAGAAGKVIMAFLDEQLARATLESQGFTGYGMTEIMGDLARIREQGYAVTTGDRVPGATGVATKVVVGDSLLGSIAVTGPAERMEPQLDRHRRLVMATADKLSMLLSSDRDRSPLASYARSGTGGIPPR